MGVDLPRRLNQLGQDFQVVLVRGKSRVLYHVAIDNQVLEVSSLNLPITAAGPCVGVLFNVPVGKVTAAPLTLTLNAKDGYTVITGNGSRSVQGVAAPITQPCVLANISTPKGQMFFGPIHGTMTLPSNKVIGVILGVEFIPGTTNAEVSLTLDSLGTPAHLFYGAGFVQRTWGSHMQKAWGHMQWSQIDRTMNQLGLESR